MQLDKRSHWRGNTGSSLHAAHQLTRDRYNPAPHTLGKCASQSSLVVFPPPETSRLRSLQSPGHSPSRLIPRGQPLWLLAGLTGSDLVSGPRRCHTASREEAPPSRGCTSRPAPAQGQPSAPDTVAAGAALLRQDATSRGLWSPGCLSSPSSDFRHVPSASPSIAACSPYHRALPTSTLRPSSAVPDAVPRVADPRVKPGRLLSRSAH